MATAEVTEIKLKSAAKSENPLWAEVGVVLHCVASLILFLFAISHFGLLSVPDLNHDFYNTVFSFAKNRTVYLGVAIVELAASIAVFRLRGRTLANIIILTFVGTMLWYRWAFFFTGGYDCNCLGLFARLVHINKVQEKVFPILALVALCAATTPWLCSVVRSRLRRSAQLTIITLVVSAQLASGDEVIEIRGNLSAVDYNPHTGQPHANKTAHSTFVATIRENSWSVFVTNVERGFTFWSARFWDGTNTYVLRPQGGSFNYTNAPHSDLQMATISPSTAAIAVDGDPLGAGFASLTFGLSPRSFRTNEAGLIEMPIPWTVVRDNPGAFGFRWEIHASAGGRFLKEATVTRDRTLDLPNEEEFRRPEVDYPETLRHYNAFLGELLIRRLGPSNYVRGHYECMEWYRTNGVELPKVSMLKVYVPPTTNGGFLPARIFSLEATEFSLRSGNGGLLPEIAKDTAVADYRYKRASEQRIFKYAEYTLKPGESWKPAGEPVLTAKADAWLKHGRKLMDFADNGKRWVTWLLLVLLLAPAVVILLKASNQKKTSLNQRPLKTLKNE